MGFRFRLQAVQKVQEFQRDAEKQTLSELITRQTELEQEEIQLQQTLENTLRERAEWMQHRMVNVAELQPFLQFESRIREQIAILQKNQKELTTQIETQRETLLTSEQEVKKFEKLEEKQREHYLKTHPDKG